MKRAMRWNENVPMHGSPLHGPPSVRFTATQSAEVLRRNGMHCFYAQNVSEPPDHQNGCCHNASTHPNVLNGSMYYCEGLATVDVGWQALQVHHAWMVTSDLAAVEITWPSVGNAYFGVVFSALQLATAVAFGPELFTGFFTGGRDFYRSAPEEAQVPIVEWQRERAKEDDGQLVYQMDPLAEFQTRWVEKSKNNSDAA